MRLGFSEYLKAIADNKALLSLRLHRKRFSLIRRRLLQAVKINGGSAGGEWRRCTNDGGGCKHDHK